MIISRGRNYIFVHAPKTGGTSMALALEARAMKDDILIGDTPKAQRRKQRLKGLSARGRLWKHSTLADIDGVVGLDELDQMFVFMLVRNPWDRMVSYYHWLQAQQFNHAAVQLAKSLSFPDFVRHPLTVRSMQASPYRHYVTDARGRERCDAFVRLEHIERDLAPVIAHLGFDLTLERTNVSRRKAIYQDYYDESLSDDLREACKQDIVQFGYRFS